MEIDYIREFLVLAENGNFMETAEKLFISQSSLTRHIKSLEEDLGATLFDRTTRKVSLNKIGKLFLPYAREITRIQYEYTTSIINELQGSHGNVKIGSIPVMIPYKITDILARFQNENVNISLDVTEGDSLQLVKMLRSGQCDFAFIREWDDSDNEFNKLPFAHDSLVALIPSNHPLAKSDSIQIGCLKHEPLLLLAKETFMYNLCVTECHNAGFEPRVAFTGHRAENILDLVSKGMGIALLMKKPIISLLNKNITMVEINPAIRTTIALAYSKNTIMIPAATHFLNLMKSIS
jgi:LysR family transcriptional regulator, transcription activator of glutamate synthase operon